jgi:outer membrane protein assembly factor BamB
MPGEGSFNDTVYAGSDDGSVYALGTGAGQLQWRLALGGRVSSGLLQNSDGEVFAGTSRGTLDSLLPLGDKQPLWTAKAGAAVRGTPAWSQQTIYFGTAGGQIRAIAMDTGAPIWTFRTAGAVASGLAVLGTALYAGDEAGYVYAIDITTARLRWRYKTGGAVRSQLLVADGLVYAGSQDHRVYALHA